MEKITKEEIIEKLKSQGLSEEDLENIASGTSYRDCMLRCDLKYFDNPALLKECENSCK